jgi:hypothetical protein
LESYEICRIRVNTAEEFGGRSLLVVSRRRTTGPAGAGPRSSKLVSALTALEEPTGRLDPRPGDGVGVRGGPGDFQRRQLFGQDLAVDATRRGAQEPTAGEEDQGEARLRQPTVRSFGVSPEDAEGTRDDAGDGEGDELGLPRWVDGDVEGALGSGEGRRVHSLFSPRHAPSCASISSATFARRPSSRLGSLVVDWCHERPDSR